MQQDTSGTLASLTGRPRPGTGTPAGNRTDRLKAGSVDAAQNRTEAANNPLKQLSATWKRLHAWQKALTVRFSGLSVRFGGPRSFLVASDVTTAAKGSIERLFGFL